MSNAFAPTWLSGKKPPRKTFLSASDQSSGVVDGTVDLCEEKCRACEADMISVGVGTASQDAKTSDSDGTQKNEEISPASHTLVDEIKDNPLFEWPSVLPLELWEMIFQHLDAIDLVRFSEVNASSRELAHCVRVDKALLKPARLVATTSRSMAVLKCWNNILFNYTPRTSLPFSNSFWNRLVRVCDLGGERLSELIIPSFLAEQAPGHFWEAARCKVLRLETAHLSSELSDKVLASLDPERVRACFQQLESLFVVGRIRRYSLLHPALQDMTQYRSNLRHLSFKGVRLADLETRTISSFENLESLEIDGFGESMLFELPESLLSCTVANAPLLSDIEAASGVSKLVISMCPCLCDIPVFDRLDVLEIRNCEQVFCVPLVSTRVTLSSTRITDISKLKNITELTLCGSSYTVFEGFEHLTRLEKFSASWCDLTSFELGSAKSLKFVILENCRGVQNAISQFRDSFSVVLSQCDVQDVALLGRVKQLVLNGTKVSSAQSLGFVNHLDLSSTPVKKLPEHPSKLRWISLQNCVNISCVHCLRSLHTVNLSHTNVTDVSCLSGLHSLDISDTDVDDVSMLGKVFKLNISGTKVSNIAMLRAVGDLALSRCYKVRDFGALGEQFKLDLSYLEEVGNNTIKLLSNVRLLNISYCINVSDLTPLKNCRELNIAVCLCAQCLC